MKKEFPSVAVAAIIAAFTLSTAGCASSPSASTAAAPVAKGLRVQVNYFEPKDFISVSGVELFQDSGSLYLAITYKASENGKFSIFNPPSGASFKILGSLAEGSGTLVRAIAKEKLSNIEGITVLFFPGSGFSDTNRTGFFFNKEQLQWNRIPMKPESLKETADFDPAAATSPAEQAGPAAQNEEGMKPRADGAIRPSEVTVSPFDSTDTYNTEVRITLEGLNDKNLKLNFDDAWTQSKNSTKIANTSSGVQASPAVFFLKTTPGSDNYRIGINVFSDRNQNGKIDEEKPTEEISSFLLPVIPGNTSRYLLRYITAPVTITVQGDVRKYGHPMIITNRMGRGSFPSKAFALTDKIELSTIVPLGYPQDNVASTCELFDDLNGNGAFDFNSDPVISDSVTIDLEVSAAKTYTLQLKD